MKVLIITDSDSKTQDTINKFLTSKKITPNHSISLFGAVKDRESVMRQIRLVTEIEKINNIIVFSKAKSLAYKERSFATLELEQETIENDLKNTCSAIRAELGDKIETKAFFVNSKNKLLKIKLD